MLISRMLLQKKKKKRLYHDCNECCPPIQLRLLSTIEYYWLLKLPSGAITLQLSRTVKAVSNSLLLQSIPSQSIATRPCLEIHGIIDSHTQNGNSSKSVCVSESALAQH